MKIISIEGRYPNPHTKATMQVIDPGRVVKIPSPRWLRLWLRNDSPELFYRSEVVP
ncbi:hypothetical protein OKW21_001395 [Catalinimonas alkaloidigena]|uniref:hypothetical protein n=1 Tax=Catalinimonas alkaloidigena TaxID=1075417 RepID=UPI0024068229|nr:hypothetical protein [Catalinimonas alkaloidigena]MDF9796132.1 hypothetical protein [Catalinimonas alkaloidigena]